MSPAGSGVLLDTSVIIDHFRGDPEFVRCLRRLWRIGSERAEAGLPHAIS